MLIIPFRHPQVSAVFDKLIEYMPLPPEGETEGDQQMADLKLNFSYVECLMFTFHGLGELAHARMSAGGRRLGVTLCDRLHVFFVQRISMTVLCLRHECVMSS